MVESVTIEVGERFELLLVEDLKRTQLVQYAGASGDYNPLHHDEVYTTQVAGFPSVFGHGMLTMGMTGRVLTDWFGDGHLTRFGVRFQRQVWPGDTLVATLTVDAVHPNGELVDVKVSTRNQAGVEVLSGYASGRTPAGRALRADEAEVVS